MGELSEVLSLRVYKFNLILSILGYILGCIVTLSGLLSNRFDILITGAILAIVCGSWSAFSFTRWEREDEVDLNMKKTELAIKQEQLRKINPKHPIFDKK